MSRRPSLPSQWASGISFAGGGAFAALVGPRALLVTAGLAIAAAWAAQLPPEAH